MNAERHTNVIKMKDDEMKFRLVIKQNATVLLDYEGYPKRLSFVTAKDMADAFEVERIIEKLIGLRVHILQVVGDMEEEKS